MNRLEVATVWVITVAFWVSYAVMAVDATQATINCRMGEAFVDWVGTGLSGLMAYLTWDLLPR